MRRRAWQKDFGLGAASPALAEQHVVSAGTDPPSRRPRCWCLAVPTSGRGHTNQSIPRGRATQAGPEDLQQEERHPLCGQAQQRSTGYLSAEAGVTATKQLCCLGSRGSPPSLPKPCSTGQAAEPTRAGPAQEHLQILLSQGGLPAAGPKTHCTPWPHSTFSDITSKQLSSPKASPSIHQLPDVLLSFLWAAGMDNSPCRDAVCFL